MPPRREARARKAPELMAALSLPEIPEMPELMRISVATDTANRDSRLEEGYQLLYSRGNAYYFIKVPENSTDERARTVGDLLGYFVFLS